MAQLDYVRSLNPSKYKRPIRMLTGGASDGDVMEVSIPVSPASSNGMGTAVIEVKEVGGLPVPVDSSARVLDQVKDLTHRINRGLVGTLPEC